MDPAFFAALNSLALGTVPLDYVDDDGAQYTVIPTPPTYKQKTAGGAAYLDVTFKLYVLSSP